MKISVSGLRNDRQWRAVIGLNKNRFYKLLSNFEKSYIEIYGMTLQESLVDNDIDYCIKDVEELLLFTLFGLKSGLINDALGFVTGMDGSSASRNQRKGVEILAKTLQKSGHIPKRNFMNIEEFKDYFSDLDIDTLLIDATEQRIQSKSPRQRTPFFNLY